MLCRHQIKWTENLFIGLWLLIIHVGKVLWLPGGVSVVKSSVLSIARLLHLSPWLVSPLIRAGLSGAARHWLRIPHHLWETWDVSFRPGGVLFFPSHTSLSHLLLLILFSGWEDTEFCLSAILDLACTGLKWQNWVQGSAEEGSVLLLLFVSFNNLTSFLHCRAEGQSLPSSLCCRFSVWLVPCRAGSAFLGINENSRA